MADAYGFPKRDAERIVRSVLASEERTKGKVNQGFQGVGPFGAFNIVRGIATTAVSPLTTTFNIDHVETLGQNTPRPASPLLVVNFPRASFNIGDVVYAIFNYATGTGTGSGGIGTGTGTGLGDWEVLVLGGGTSLARGLLFDSLPDTGFIFATTTWSRGAAVLPQCIIVEVWDPENNRFWPAWAGVEDGEEWDVVYGTAHRIAAINGTMQAIRGSEGAPVRVWGQLTQAHLGTGTGIGDAFEIIHHDYASSPGHVLDPPTTLGQTIWHPPGQHCYQADAGPCDGAGS